MEDKFYNLALRFLSYRPRSEKEVRDKLKALMKRYDGVETTIEKIISKLKEQRFINDEEFAMGWITQRSTFKPRGIRLIKLELKHKGIADDLIDRLIHNSEFIIQNDLEQAKRLVEKRLLRYRGLDKQKIYEKLGRFLASKGFDWDTIKKAIDPVKS